MSRHQIELNAIVSFWRGLPPDALKKPCLHEFQQKLARLDATAHILVVFPENTLTNR